MFLSIFRKDYGDDNDDLNSVLHCLWAEWTATRAITETAQCGCY
jgi:hypothetical protein